ncbi:endonuclease domain-containing protein [Granulicoccus phenolivorans]|uniref:endonuclease domain-containing protein n=1 Tax=Granulicoccus phenolivorans TaxID=266854 RepID=UPI00042391D8|nr:DUF559 domain-containing protein [Granulicoccus phenolivorans]
MEVLRLTQDRARIRALQRKGGLIRLLPGIYSDELSARALIRATALKDPDAIVLGLGARWLGWREQEPPIRLTVASRHRFGSDHITAVRRVIPLDFTAEATLRFTTPAYTAVDLIPALGGAVVDEVLLHSGEHRAEQALAQMWTALAAMPGRTGNPERRQILRDSRDRPWSEAERMLHQMLRRAGITGWRTNVRVSKAGWVVDLIFPQHRIAIEFDGWEFHRSHRAFIDDRTKSNDLQTEGWMVIRLAWEHLEDRALPWIRHALALRRGVPILPPDLAAEGKVA